MKDYENNKKCTESSCDYYSYTMELNCSYSEDNSKCVKTVEPLSSHAVLGEVLAELMAEIEQENKEERVSGMSLTNSECNQIKLDDLAYGYELRFKKVLGKYFA